MKLPNPIKSCVMILTLRCEQSARLTSDAFERPLSRTERAALWVHRLNCRWCRRMKSQYQAMAQWNHCLHRYSDKQTDRVTLPADARARMLKKISENK